MSTDFLARDRRRTDFDHEMDILREKLQKAAEIELTTIPAYLTALLSIEPGTNVEAAAVVRSVMMEEMLHLILAGNTLSAVGGRLELGAQQIPVYPEHLQFKGKGFRDRDFSVNLARLDRDNIETFLKIELPEGFKEPGELDFRAKEVVIEGYTLGDFYRSIEADLDCLSKEFGQCRVFCGDRQWQVGEEYYWAGGGKPIEVYDLKTAISALHQIVEQGEGSDGSISDGDFEFGQPNEVAHYFRFNEIYVGRYYAPGNKPHEPPSGELLQVDYDKVYPIKPNCKSSDFAGAPRLEALNTSFNAAYSLMLRQIAEGFRGNQKVLYTAIMNGMHKLTPVARQMMQLEIPGDPEGRHAAPSFEWVDPPLGV